MAMFVGDCVCKEGPPSDPRHSGHTLGALPGPPPSVDKSSLVGLGLAGEVGAGTGLDPGRCGHPQVLLATVTTPSLALRGLSLQDDGTRGLLCVGSHGASMRQSVQVDRGVGSPCSGHSRDKGLVAGWATRGREAGAVGWVGPGPGPGTSSLAGLHSLLPRVLGSVGLCLVPPVHGTPSSRQASGKRPGCLGTLARPWHGLGHLGGGVPRTWGEDGQEPSPPAGPAGPPPCRQQCKCPGVLALLFQSQGSGAFPPGPHLLCGSTLARF